MKVMLENDRWTKVREGNMKKKENHFIFAFFLYLISCSDFVES